MDRHTNLRNMEITEGMGKDVKDTKMMDGPGKLTPDQKESNPMRESHSKGNKIGALGGENTSS